MNHSLINKLEKIVGKISRIEILADQGCTSEVCRVETEWGRYILKTSFKNRYREWLKAEAQVLEKISSNKVISVPDYFGFIEERDRSHLIMSYIEGITLTKALTIAPSNAERHFLIQSFGEFLQTLHDLEQVDELKREGGDWLDAQLEKAENYILNGETKGSLSLLAQLKLKKPHFIPQTIIHGDCTTDNVLVRDGKVCVFIDVSGMTVGDPRYDECLAISNFENQSSYIDAFYKGYRRYRVSKEEIKYFDEGLYEFF